MIFRSYACTRKTCKGASDSGTVSEWQRRLIVDDDKLDCWSIFTNASDSCTSDSLQCTLGSTGPLCGSCDAGFFYSSSDYVCQSCSNSHVSKAVSVLVVGLVVGVLAGSLYSGVLEVPKGMQNTWIVGLFQRIDSGILRVVWSNYQVLFCLK